MTSNKLRKQQQPSFFSTSILQPSLRPSLRGCVSMSLYDLRTVPYHSAHQQKSICVLIESTEVLVMYKRNSWFHASYWVSTNLFQWYTDTHSPDHFCPSKLRFVSLLSLSLSVFVAHLTVVPLSTQQYIEWEWGWEYVHNRVLSSIDSKFVSIELKSKALEWSIAFCFGVPLHRLRVIYRNSLFQGLSLCICVIVTMLFDRDRDIHGMIWYQWESLKGD